MERGANRHIASIELYTESTRWKLWYQAACPPAQGGKPTGAPTTRLAPVQTMAIDTVPKLRQRQ